MALAVTNHVQESVEILAVEEGQKREFKDYFKSKFWDLSDSMDCRPQRIKKLQGRKLSRYPS